MTSTQWIEYHNETKRKSYNTLPTSNITAEAVTVGGFTLSQTDNAGVTTTAGRSYTANGMIHTYTDGRGNTSTTVTDAQGNTSCYRYDVRGRMVAEWGTGMQPVLFGYDDADRMTSLTTFRAGTETINTAPSERTDGDVTSWSYHQWSSEYNDTELGLVYYNYRHYNPMEGRWLRRDIIEDVKSKLYLFAENYPSINNDLLGLFVLPWGNGFLIEPGTFEVTFPLTPIFDIVGNITVEGADCFCKQKISISIGGAWSLKNLILRKLESTFKFISQYIANVSLSVFGEAAIEALCGNTDLCTISLGVALTAGNGRRNLGLYRIKHRRKNRI